VHSFPVFAIEVHVARREIVSAMLALQSIRTGADCLTSHFDYNLVRSLPLTAIRRDAGIAIVTPDVESGCWLCTVESSEPLLLLSWLYSACVGNGPVRQGKKFFFCRPRELRATLLLLTPPKSDAGEGEMWIPAGSASFHGANPGFSRIMRLS
jgi:hypothetical protein